MIAGMFWNSGFSSFASITNIVTLSTTWKEEDTQLVQLDSQHDIPIWDTVMLWTKWYLALSICDADKDINRILFLMRGKGKSVRRHRWWDKIILFWGVESVYLSVQVFHQCDISRYGVNPKVFFGPGIKRKAIPDLLTFRVCAIETIYLCTYERVAKFILISGLI